MEDKTVTIKIGTKTYKCWYEYELIHYPFTSDFTLLKVSGTESELSDVCEYAKLMGRLDDDERQNYKINIETEQLIFNGCWLKKMSTIGNSQYIYFGFDYMKKKRISPKEIKNKVKQLFGM